MSVGISFINRFYNSAVAIHFRLKFNTEMQSSTSVFQTMARQQGGLDQLTELKPPAGASHVSVATRPKKRCAPVDEASQISGKFFDLIQLEFYFWTEVRFEVF